MGGERTKACGGSTPRSELANVEVERVVAQVIVETGTDPVDDLYFDHDFTFTAPRAPPPGR
jgi:hypothetical protein